MVTSAFYADTKKNLILASALAALIFSSSCSNVQSVKPVAVATATPEGAVFDFYHPVLGVTGNVNVNPTYIYAGSQEEATADYNRYLQQGYRLLGYSGFSNLSASPIPEQQALAKAKSIGADIALYCDQGQGRLKTRPSSRPRFTVSRSEHWRPRSSARSRCRSGW